MMRCAHALSTSRQLESIPLLDGMRQLESIPSLESMRWLERASRLECTRRLHKYGGFEYERTDQLMQRPDPDEYNPFYAAYVERVPKGDVISEMKTQIHVTSKPILEMSEDDARSCYAPGKWSIKEVVGHVCDTERIMTYRALRIARGDATPLPGFDEKAFVSQAGFGQRTTTSLLDEWHSVRDATLRLFEGFLPEVAARRGIASDAEVSVRALAYIIVGHELHHRVILQERYGVAYS